MKKEDRIIRDLDKIKYGISTILDWISDINSMINPEMQKHLPTFDDRWQERIESVRRYLNEENK